MFYAASRRDAALAPLAVRVPSSRFAFSEEHVRFRPRGGFVAVPLR